MAWFTPKCPVDSEDKAWIEEWMLWLIEEFGAETFRDITVVLPTDEFFPDPFEDEDDLTLMVNRVCGYMGVDPSRVEVDLFTEQNKELHHGMRAFEASHEGVAGHYRKRRGKFFIGVESTQLDNPMSLIATVAHELAHVRLLGEQRIPYDHEANEPLTDLLTVCLGMGIFTANSVFSFNQWTDTFSQGWEVQRHGYLTEEMFGYALAIFAWTRSESDPVWSKFLQGNVRDYFRHSEKYLAKTGDTTLGRL